MSEDTSYPNASRTPMSLSSETLRLDFVGKPIDFFFVLLKNLLLTLVTLGLYYPWARAQRLRYIYNNTRIGDHALSFTGHGLEIAKGYLMVILFYLSISGLSILVQSQSASYPFLGFIIMLVVFFLMYMLIGFAIWSAQAYRASRLRYRSIYFSQDPSARRLFVMQVTFDFILTLVTFGLYLPVTLHHINQGLIDGLRWGNQNFHYTATLRSSYKLSLFNFFASIFTLGLYFPFANAKRLNFTFNHTTLGQDMRLSLQLKALDVLKISFFPVIANTLTLGLAFPWVDAYRRRTLYRMITVNGSLNYTDVHQIKAPGSARGEGLSDFLNLDAGFGV